MKEFVEYIIKSIVDDMDAVVVEEQTNDSVITLSVKVAPEEMGRVIGKEGRIIKSIRALVRAKAMKMGLKVDLNLIDPRENGAATVETEEAQNVEADAQD